MHSANAVTTLKVLMHTAKQPEIALHGATFSSVCEKGLRITSQQRSSATVVFTETSTPGTSNMPTVQHVLGGICFDVSQDRKAKVTKAKPEKPEAQSRKQSGTGYHGPRSDTAAKPGLFVWMFGWLFRFARIRACAGGRRRLQRPDTFCLFVILFQNMSKTSRTDNMVDLRQCDIFTKYLSNKSRIDKSHRSLAEIDACDSFSFVGFLPLDRTAVATGWSPCQAPSASPSGSQASQQGSEGSRRGVKEDFRILWTICMWRVINVTQKLTGGLIIFL